MGLRYRKSISFLGGAFRINFSKSGIGYSYGVRGARVTRMANGRTRTTLSIPGTGISYVSESGKKRTVNKSNIADEQSDLIYSHSIENDSAEKIVSVEEKDFIHALKVNRLVARLLKWLNIILFIGLFVVSIQQNGKPAEFGIFDALLCCWLIIFLFSIWFSIFGKIKLTYEIDDYGTAQFAKVNKAIELLKSNKMVWQVNDVYRNTSGRTHAGATSSVVRRQIKIIKKNPHFLRTNVKCFSLKLKREQLYFLPDKVLIVYKNKIGAVSYKDLKLFFGDVSFRETNPPKDAFVKGHTWQYVNNNGGPDKRFKNNYQVAICRYGTITGKSDAGIDIMLQCSNFKTTVEIQCLLKN